jgi:hypothetical protein
MNTFLARASLYLSDHTDAELVAMWAAPQTDRLRPNTFVRFRTLYAIVPAIDVKGIKDRMLATYQALLQSTDPALLALGDQLQATYGYMMGQREDDGIDVGRPTVRAVARALTQAIVPGVAAVIPDAATLDAILAPGGSEYTWLQEDGLGDQEAHFAAARVAKARLDAVAASGPALVAWQDAEVAKVQQWAAGGFAGDLAALTPFAYPAGGQ